MSSIKGDPFPSTVETALRDFDKLIAEYKTVASEEKSRILDAMKAQVNETVNRHQPLKQEDRFINALSDLTLKAFKANGSELAEIQESMRKLYAENNKEIPSYLKKEAPAASQAEPKPVITVAPACQDASKQKVEKAINFNGTLNFSQIIFKS